MLGFSSLFTALFAISSCDLFTCLILIDWTLIRSGWGNYCPMPCLRNAVISHSPIIMNFFDQSMDSGCNSSFLTSSLYLSFCREYHYLVPFYRNSSPLSFLHSIHLFVTFLDFINKYRMLLIFVTVHPLYLVHFTSLSKSFHLKQHEFHHPLSSPLTEKNNLMNIFPFNWDFPQLNWFAKFV